jgi:hypothetical protein
MKNTWRYYLRRIAAVTFVSGATAWSSAMCYAVTLAYDDATDPVYNNGWQEGDDGGGAGGFGPWNFDGTYNTANQQAMDDGLKAGTQTSNPHNDLGEAWTMFNPVGRPKGTSNGAVGTDIARVGRSFPALQVDQTLSIVVDNPSESFFFRGHTIKLNTGENGNQCFEGRNCTELDSMLPTTPNDVVPMITMGTFAYTEYGQWYDPALWDDDTNNGVKIDFKLTSITAYSITMTPLDNPGLAHTINGNLPTGKDAITNPIDWIQIELYNTDSDTYPNFPCVPGAGCMFSNEDAYVHMEIGPPEDPGVPLTGNIRPTDYYIRSIEITKPDPAGEPGDYNNDGKVDAADYVVWRKTNGTGFDLPNEVSGTTPGEVTIDDYNEWRERFGNGGAGAGGGLDGGSVPEPGTILLVIAGAAGLGSIGLRRARKTVSRSEADFKRFE